MGSRSAIITGTGRGVPARVVTNFDLEKLVDTSDAWITTRTGIRERRIAGPEEVVSTFAATACRQAMDMAGIGPADVGLIICATVTPDMPIPATACLLQELLGCKGAAAFDMSAGCSGFIYAQSVAKQFLITGMIWAIIGGLMSVLFRLQLGYPDAHFQAVLDRLGQRFPGSGSLVERYDAWRRAFVIPREKLDTVFTAAVGACRERTRQHVKLPAGEHFTVEYVTNKSWSGYNWYQGGFRSLIQVNTDLPIYIDRAIDLACHEGYPGHHVYNALLEQHLVKDRGWLEFTVYPLFSPQSLIAEGTANFGIEVAFPGRERVAYERDTLFPLAGLDASRAAEYYDVMALVDQLSYAGNEAARRYLNGQMDAAAATAWLERYALMPHDRAAQRVRFFDQYRSYVINYNYGKDLVRTFIESRGGTPDRPDRRWQEFETLLSSPRLPSGLR